MSALAAALRELLARPPPSGGLAELEWNTRWNRLVGLLKQTWSTDHDAVIHEMPGLLEALDTWPDPRRQLHREWFELIGSDKGTDFFGAVAPLFRHLDLRDGGRRVAFQPRKYQRFFLHPVASCLRSIELCNTHLTAPMAALVARSAAMKGLESLSFDRTAIGPAGVLALAGSPHFSSLRELNLYMVALDDPSLLALLAAPFTGQLTALHLGGSKVTISQINAIAACEALAALERLSLRAASLEEEELGLLLRSPFLGKLRRLDVRDNPALDRSSSGRPGLELLTGSRGLG